MEAEANETTGMNLEEVNAFSGLTDEELITEIKEHTNSDALDYLINKYRNFVRAKARSYFLIGADREDIIQEGMIGFYMRHASDHHGHQDGDAPETHPAQFLCFPQQAHLR